MVIEILMKIIVIFRQLINLSQLFEPHEVIEFIFPIALALCSDKVADVRSSAAHLVSAVLFLLNDFSFSVLRSFMTTGKAFNLLSDT